MRNDHGNLHRTDKPGGPFPKPWNGPVRVPFPHKGRERNIHLLERKGERPCQ